ncbi:MAG TPA: sarcosine oxidase subunit gamma family protein [Actinomycetota bacterium]|nr:sarcosine oxidase subunit gamma family protein [Actinomycetota bacterium]
MTARSALAHRATDLERLEAVEIPFLTQLAVRAEPATVAALGFPVDPNTAAYGTGWDLLWLGPDEWLVVADPGNAVASAAALEGSLAGGHHSVVDVSANRAVLELRGAGRHELLASACPLDLHRRAWGEGRCAQTLFGAAPVLLQERLGATRVFVRPSFAGYVVDLLRSAAA